MAPGPRGLYVLLRTPPAEEARVHLLSPARGRETCGLSSCAQRSPPRGAAWGLSRTPQLKKLSPRVASTLPVSAAGRWRGGSAANGSDFKVHALPALLSKCEGEQTEGRTPEGTGTTPTPSAAGMDTRRRRNRFPDLSEPPGRLPTKPAKQISLRLLGPREADGLYDLHCCVVPHSPPHPQSSDACLFKQRNQFIHIWWLTLLSHGGWCSTCFAFRFQKRLVAYPLSWRVC